MAIPKQSTDTPQAPAQLVRAARERAAADDPAGAVELLVQAIGQRRDLPLAWWSLGQVLESLGRWVEASRAYEQAAQLRSSDAHVQRDYGRALVKVGRLEEAVRRLRRAASLAPRSAECQDLLGLAYHASGRRAEARMAYRRAIELDPTRASAHHHLGLLLAERGDIQPALEHLRQATELAPERPIYHRELARASLRAKHVALARLAASRALEHDPDDPVAHLVMGWTHEMAGDRSASVTSYRRALDLDPHLSGPYYKLARLGELEDLDGIARELERPGRSTLERSELYFARAEILNRKDKPDQAWCAWSQGNAENSSAISYDRAGHRDLVERIIRATPAELFQGSRGMGDPNRMPAFIVGMPRSGTSLIEQLLAVHPQILPLGEHTGVHDLGRTLRRYTDAQREFPEGLADLERDDAVRMASDYLRSFEKPAGDFERIVDKAPGNFHYLGLIAMMLPNACVIHVKRDPLDTCVSNWTTNYGQQRCVFASDLDDLADYYEDYQRLMAHWARVLPIRVHELEYEAFVADPGGEARKLHQFLDVPWNPACLDFHRSKRDVLTASALQVRQPVHRRSVGRWRKFESHLGPLLRLRG